ncbi:5-formyltetrahydrofolate cyclo-ligase [Marinimicrobium sp. ABcell2]|uniref:5-formyltetrahydrofolate cyclo-ligase n=1 Tax=Marinimicrobium sp. ABcell2 TaxID=3069751 RepID=UPI0027B7036F|nr:5-formyltetrahydrofolate cyclo-ligase [Marinimicrobium sp. ABcell2]MDQ2076143.1 5-formyltetrahydrofolate cyclo-ligase [Marinimicrobium sp. ABcell2]
MGQTHTNLHAELAHAKRQMRRQMRARRRRLSPGQQRRAAHRLAKLLVRFPAFVRSRHIALYLPNDGEIDPRPLARLAWRMGKRCYLPVLHPLKARQLAFVRFKPDTRLFPNRFGIPEPAFGRNQWLAPHYLDLVLLPLVAFDRAGGRLGMGGGFYDSTFAFKRQKRWGPHRKPQLMGLAHSCQETKEVVRENWDLPLSAVVTDHEIIAARAQ